jgi:acyl-coenzyme A synthetase/AMP-(fatty) acid ligase
VRGDEVLACVIPAHAVAVDGMAAAAAELTSFCLKQLAYYKAPGYVAFVESLPLTATQKLQRGELKALARRLPGTPGCVDTRHMKRRQV